MSWQQFQQAAEEALAQGQVADAERLYRSFFDETKKDESAHAPRALAVKGLSELLAKRSAYTEAEAILFETLNALECASPRDNLAVSTILEALGNVYLLRKEHYRAAVFFSRAAVLRKAAGEVKSASMANLLAKLAKAEVMLGNLPEAETLMRRTLKKKEAIFGSEHPTLAESLFDLGDLLKRMERFNDAEVLLLRALNLVGEPNVKNPLSIRILESLAEVYLQMGQTSAAVDLLSKALVLFEQDKSIAPHEVLKLTARINQLKGSAPAEKAKQTADEQLELLLQEFEHIEEHDPRNSIRLRELSQQLADMLEERSKYVDALRFRKQEMDLTERLFGYNHPESVRSLSSLVRSNLLMDDLKEAGAYLQEILDIQDYCFGITPEDRLNTYLLLAEHSHKSGDMSSAENWVFVSIPLLEVSSEKAKHRLLKEIQAQEKLHLDRGEKESAKRMNELKTSLLPHGAEVDKTNAHIIDDNMDKVMREHGIIP
ncbi:MAG TPA: tetratricopeptide repeat protein [Candidatus Melainabacteria bacterium]|nr:tetratricopeptide repeat protein [Candidatus Melainabacteria bacterium]HIN66548.1 tetratricopeptide repeat protein [Candidatus Obscuribacterales bacterium]